jgi:hypothetical protein
MQKHKKILAVSTEYEAKLQLIFIIFYFLNNKNLKIQKDFGSFYGIRRKTTTDIYVGTITVDNHWRQSILPCCGSLLKFFHKNFHLFSKVFDVKQQTFDNPIRVGMKNITWCSVLDTERCL